jgi:hypothetical protein
VESSPAVANGVVYVGANAPNIYYSDNLYAFDATGTTNCSGTPKVCQPLWIGQAEGGVESSPAVANGEVYVNAVGHIVSETDAFDASGTTNCSGTPKICQPLWEDGTSDFQSSPSVANGLLYVAGQFLSVLSDANGNLLTNVLGACCFGPSSPAIANGMVYIGSTASADGLSAFGRMQTQVLVPSDGSTVSGSTLLDASATGSADVASVRFEVSGGSLSDQVVGTATPTLYGWLAEWDTTTVPNGTYTLQSVAFDDQSPDTVTSPGITVTVDNRAT